MTAIVLVAVLGAAAIYMRTARPHVDVYSPVTVEQAYAGTTYAFDGLACLRAGAGTVELSEVARANGPQGLVVEVGPKPEGAAPTIGFPVQQGPATRDLRVAAGEQECLRVTARPDSTGTFRAPQVEVPLRYGPGGLLRRTAEIRLPITLDVTSTGADPRSGSAEAE